MSTWKCLWSAMGLMMLLSVGLMAEESKSGSPRPGRLRIGTYNTRAVALAYGRSEGFLKRVADWHREAQQAKAAGDEKKLAELKAQAEPQQRRLHAQVFSNAPIDDILPQLRDALPEIAKQANVVAILPSADWHDAAAVEVVDVTDALVQQFKPTGETLRMIEDLRKHPPVDLMEIDKHKH